MYRGNRELTPPRVAVPKQVGSDTATLTVTVPASGDLFYDDFQRADAKLTTPWVKTVGAYGDMFIYSGSVRVDEPAVTGQKHWCANGTSIQNGNIEAYVSWPAATREGGFIFRNQLTLRSFIDIANDPFADYPPAYPENLPDEPGLLAVSDCYICTWQYWNATQARVTWYAYTGSFRNFRQVTPSWSGAGVNVKARVNFNGSNFQLYWNDVLIDSASDSALAAAGTCGLRGYSASADAVNKWFVHDFRVFA